MSCGKCFEESTASGGGHGVSKVDAVAGGGGGLPRRDAGGYLRCINPGCSRRPRVKADDACKQCGSKMHCLGEEDQKVVSGLTRKAEEAKKRYTQQGQMPNDVSDNVVSLLEREARKHDRINDAGIVEQIDGLIAVYSKPSTFPAESNTDNTTYHLQGTSIDEFSMDSFPDPSAVIELNLEGNNLTRLPPEIAQFTNLKKLNLSNNQITHLPPEIGKLTNLEELEVDGTLSDIPPQIRHLKKLRRFSAASGGMSKIPQELIGLPELEEVDLSRNWIEEIPPEVGNMPNLRYLDLSSNELEEVPSELGNLSDLDELDLSGNDIRTLPSEISQLGEANINLEGNNPDDLELPVTLPPLKAGGLLGLIG